MTSDNTLLIHPVGIFRARGTTVLVLSHATLLHEYALAHQYVVNSYVERGTRGRMQVDVRIKLCLRDLNDGRVGLIIEGLGSSSMLYDID